MALKKQCNFVCSFPDYVLDRTIVIEDGHEHKISGFKLANASEYFKVKLKEMRAKEIQACQQKLDNENTEKNSELVKKESIDSNKDKRKRTRSLNEIEIDQLIVTYDDINGLEYVLSFIHCPDDLNNPQLKVSEFNILSILKAGGALKVPAVLEHCFDYIKSAIDCNNCWDYLAISNDIQEYNPEICEYVYDFLLKNFTDTFQNEKMLDLTQEKLKDFLKNDKLNCKKEISLLKIIDRWIEHDESARVQYCPDLIECIRLKKLTTEEQEEVWSNKYVRQNLDHFSSLLSCFQVDPQELLKDNNGLSVESVERIQYMMNARLPREAIIVVGGWEGAQDDANFGPSKAIQIYNCRTDTWKRLVTERFALNEGHAYSGCVMFNNKLYVVGGYVSSGPTQMLKVFDLVTLCWKYLSPMHEKRNYISVCSLDDCIYAIGGHNGRMRLSSVEKYDTVNNHWILVAPMRQIRSDAGSDSSNGKVYVCGGFDGHHFYASVEIYDPIVNQWTNAAPMSNIRSGVSMVSFGAYLYALGGNDGLQRLRSVERYDIERNKWQLMPSMIRQRSNFCVSVLENDIFVMGGWSDETNSTISLAEKWTPGINNEWKSIQSLIMPASANCCSSIYGLNFIESFLGQ